MSLKPQADFRQDGVTADERVRRHANPGASLLAVLHAIQDEAGYIPADVIAPLAQATPPPTECTPRNPAVVPLSSRTHGPDFWFSPWPQAPALSISPIPAILTMRLNMPP